MNRDKMYLADRVRSGWFTLSILAILMTLFFLSGAMAADILIQPQLVSKIPKIDGVVSAGEWSGARVTSLPFLINNRFAVMRTMNDAKYLYILLDALSDTGKDRGVVDYYVLAFDAGHDHRVTPREDLFYSACNDGRSFIKAYYLSANSWTGCTTPAKGSLGKYGFGSTPNSATAHRFYEFRLLLSEIGGDPSRLIRFSGGLPSVRLNVTIRSATPKIDYSYPTKYSWPDMSDTMFLIQLAPASSLPVTGDMFAGVGLIPAVPYIDNLGYANINTAYFNAVDAPFGGSLSIFGNWGNLRSYNAAKYRIQYTRREGGASGNLIQTWTNYRYNPVTLNWDPVAIGPLDSAGGYAIPPTSETWYYPNLLVNWQSDNPIFPNGTYDLKAEIFDAADNPITIPPSVVNSLTLFIVNTPPSVKINQVQYNDAQVLPCQIIGQGAAPSGFNFDISVTDANGALDRFGLGGLYGNNEYSYVIPDETYSPGHVDEDGANKWKGKSNLILPVGGARWRAPASCGYSFVLWASSRILNGYALVFPYVDYHVSLTIQTDAIISATPGAGGCPDCGAASAGSESGCKPMGL
jgi:hypothetical protein